MSLTLLEHAMPNTPKSIVSTIHLLCAPVSMCVCVSVCMCVRTHKKVCSELTPICLCEEEHVYLGLVELSCDIMSASSVDFYVLC